MKASAIAHPNIAFIKYWGRDENQEPYNKSISMTLDAVETHTTVTFSKDLKNDTLILNGNQESGSKLNPVTDMLDLVRKKTGLKIYAKVVSKNNFPTGAGIASSASGFCALAYAAFDALNYDISLKELSKLLGKGPSGSAARSVFGDIVSWQHYSQKFDEWKELRDIIIISQKSEKKVASRIGMQRTVKTSHLYKDRIAHIKKRTERISSAIINRNHEILFKEIMKESNNLHAVMLDTWPPLIYMNDDSRNIIEQILHLNKKKVVAGYTFDAGPNAHIITLKKNVPMIMEALSSIKDTKIISRPGKGVHKTDEHL